MSTTEAPGFIDRHMGRIVIGLVLATCVCLAGLGYLQVQYRSQAAEGAAARERQIRVLPVSCKEHTDAWRRSVITYRELVHVWGCPKPPRITP